MSVIIVISVLARVALVLINTPQAIKIPQSAINSAKNTKAPMGTTQYNTIVKKQLYYCIVFEIS